MKGTTTVYILSYAIHVDVQVYKAIKDDLKTGGRAFIVYPLVDVSKSEATKHLMVCIALSVCFLTLHGRRLEPFVQTYSKQ